MVRKGEGAKKGKGKGGGTPIGAQMKDVPKKARMVDPCIRHRGGKGCHTLALHLQFLVVIAKEVRGDGGECCWLLDSQYHCSPLHLPPALGIELGNYCMALNRKAPPKKKFFSNLNAGAAL